MIFAPDTCKERLSIFESASLYPYIVNNYTETTHPLASDCLHNWIAVYGKMFNDIEETILSPMLTKWSLVLREHDLDIYSHQKETCRYSNREPRQEDSGHGAPYMGYPTR